MQSPFPAQYCKRSVISNRTEPAFIFHLSFTRDDLFFFCVTCEEHPLPHFTNSFPREKRENIVYVLKITLIQRRAESRCDGLVLWPKPPDSSLEIIKIKKTFRRKIDRVVWEKWIMSPVLYITLTLGTFFNEMAQMFVHFKSGL